MEWHEYLREERAQKIRALELFIANKLEMMEMRDGQRVNANGRTVAQLRQNIADIEDILRAAGQSLE